MMKFQTKRDNTVYVVVPKTSTYNIQGMKILTGQGLRAEFGGRHNIWDSEIAQKRKGWSDEDRIRVEKYLLNHRSFGHGLYLAFGEQIPEYLQDEFTVQTTEHYSNCEKFWVDGDLGEIVQCPNKVIKGLRFCAEHDPDKEHIFKGIGTTSREVPDAMSEKMAKLRAAKAAKKKVAKKEE